MAQAKFDDAEGEHSLDLGVGTSTLDPTVRQSLEIQRSSLFWREPKDLLLTLVACCLASMTQGWDQVANGNLGWKEEFNIHVDFQDPNTSGIWKFAAVQAMPWFAASLLGSYLSDPLSEWIGRRGALLVAASFSLMSSIAGSRANSWETLLGTRVLLGLGIGGKASIVPILESEILPSGKRGRLLVSWQVFTATGLFLGSVACYVFRSSWRNEILSGAIPAFALIISTFASCESPRWLIIQGYYKRAFTTLVRLRKSRILAAKEIVSIHYQIQAERSLFTRRHRDEEDHGLNPFQRRHGRTTYWERLYNMVAFPRIRRAAIASMVVMISQQLSGINIYAFLATQFFSTAGPAKKSESTPQQARQNEANSFKFAIGFGGANMLFSTVAYFLVENKDPTPVEEPTSEELEGDPSPSDEEGPQRREEHILPDDQTYSTPMAHASPFSATRLPCPSDENAVRRSNASSITSISSSNGDNYYDYGGTHQLRGRRFLLLTSLAAGVVTLSLTSAMFHLSEENKARLPMIIFFIIVFTAFYSPGAGAIPFLYCAEIWPNEGRELGMSWSTFWNFLGSGILALFVPHGINWGHEKLLGLFSALNFIGYVLVWFLVPSTNATATLEDMNYIFGRKLRDHAKAQWKRLLPRSHIKGPRIHWRRGRSGTETHQAESTRIEPPQSLPSPQMRQQAPEEYVLAQVEK